MFTSSVIEMLGRFHDLCHVHCAPSSRRKFLSISIVNYTSGSSSYINFNIHATISIIVNGINKDHYYLISQRVGQYYRRVQIEVVQGRRASNWVGVLRWSACGSTLVIVDLVGVNWQIKKVVSL